MTLLIATTDGTTTFRIDQAEVDLISISKVDLGIGFAETSTTVIEGVTTFPVVYTQNETGPTPTRLNALVNNAGGVTASPRVVIFAVDNTYVLSDGTPASGNGIATPVGSSANPFTADVCAFYDSTLCGGAGVWVDKEGGGTTQQSTDIVLYHELSHCFHYNTGTTAATSALEEVAAETDENDMHDVLGYAHRNVNSHNGGCGGGPPATCCIIASLVTGSPYSREVNLFRLYREQTLRASDVGDDFFQRFFHSYYGFSPEVVRLMGREASLPGVVRQNYVLPVLAAVELLIHYAQARGTTLAGLLRQQLGRAEFGEAFSELNIRNLIVEVNLASALLEESVDSIEDVPSIEVHPSDWDARMSELAMTIRTRLTDEGLLRWALVDTVGLWARGILMVHEGSPDESIDAQLRHRLASWISGLPISDIWKTFSRLKAESELQMLDEFIFDPEARAAFGERLGAALPHLAATAAEWARAGAGRDA